MVGLSDAVFAIALTLLVLELAIGESGSALERLADGWPSYLAYALSFFTLGAAWLFHNALTDGMETGDRTLLRLNLLVLLFVGFLPFPTQLISESVNDSDAQQVFTTLYGLSLLGIAVTLFLLDTHARRSHLVGPMDAAAGAEVDGVGEESMERRLLRRALIAYPIAIAVGIFVPRLALALYWLIALYLALPFRALARYGSRETS
jgi:uncharacterized membrane protein